jgi:hypothetical protein
MPAPVPVQPLVLAYAHGSTAAAPFRVPLWLLAGLLPAVIAIPLAFSRGYSPLDALAAVADSLRTFSWIANPLNIDNRDTFLFCLAIGLSLGLPALVLSSLIGRALRTARVAALCVLPIAIFGMIVSAYVVVWLMIYGRPHTLIACSPYSVVFLAGLGFLIRSIRRHCPLTQLTLLALTTEYLGIALVYLLIGDYKGPNRGYYITAIGCPFYFLLALRLIRHTPANP